MYAITPSGVGRPVGARAIEPGWPLADGETFAVDDWYEDLVLAEDGKSLRAARPGDPSAEARARTVSARALIRRLPEAKQKAIVAAAAVNSDVAFWLYMTTAGPVDLHHPETAKGIDNLIAAGLLDADDRTALLADAAADELP